MKRSKSLPSSVGDRRIRVTSDPRDPPDLRLYARALLALVAEQERAEQTEDEPAPAERGRSRAA